AQPTSQVEAIAALFSVIRNVAQPFRVPDPGKPDASQTIWQTVPDLTHRRLGFQSTTRPNGAWVDLAKAGLSEGAGARKLDLHDQLAIEGGPAGNVRAKVADMGSLKLLSVAMLKQLKAGAKVAPAS